MGDARISTPAVFVENSVECPRNPEGDAVLPSGQVWRRQMLMMIFSMRIMSQADSLLDSQPQDRNMSQQQRMLQQLFQQQRGQKLPPLPYLVPNMIRHAGVSLKAVYKKAILAENRQLFNLQVELWKNYFGYMYGQYEDRTHDLGVISTTL